MERPKCMLTVDVEALGLRAADHHVETLIYGRFGGEEWGIGRMMDIADKHGVKMTFFLDFAEVELYGDEIIEAGRYIVSRGHDLQIHCHYDLLTERVLSRFPRADRSYYTWYKNEEISDFIADYCLEQYRKCGARGPAVFRGGEYRFGLPLLKKLREKGVAADASYNFLRPQKRPINRQFVFEDGLLELPVGILPDVPAGILPEETRRTALNFNLAKLYPLKEDDWKHILPEYRTLLGNFYTYYGGDAIGSILLHSWSFCHEMKRFQDTGYIDRPNPYAPDLFDRFLSEFAPEIEFITAGQAARLGPELFTKTVDYDAVFSFDNGQSAESLKQVLAFIQKKARGREVVIWGRGWLERITHEVLNFSRLLEVPFYISQDAPTCHQWRGRPVKTFEEAGITPDRYYVFVAARSCFPEIRETLRASGFSEYEDYCDLEKPMPQEEWKKTGPEPLPPCPICGGEVYDNCNTEYARRCVNCGSLERTRTMAKLFAEDLGREKVRGRVLHVSPSKSEKMVFKRFGAEQVTTVDVRPQLKTDIVADICDMPQVPSDSFDLVLANCVLNHVYDDEAALAEICRVLRRGGLFVVNVLGGNRMKTTVDADPAAWYGQQAMEEYRVGTYRHYGEADFTAQLRRYFHKVRCYEKYDAVTKSSCCWYVCEK